MNIEENQDQFLEEMSRFKSNLINALSSENVEKYREEYKGRYNPERFKELFVEKLAIHIIFKYTLIRIIEESMSLVNKKLNKEGLDIWHGLSKNFREDYNVLYEIAVSDVRREDEVMDIFINTVFDGQAFIDKTKLVMNQYIPILSKYKYETINASITLSLIDYLYNNEKQNELNGLTEKSPVINFLLQQVGLN